MRSVRASAIIAIFAGLLGSTLPATAGTIAFWRFQEGNANASATGGNSILDSSGNGLNGTPFLGPVYRPVTNPNSTLGLQFTGGNQRVFIPDSPLLAITQSLTLEAFIRFDGTPAATEYFSQIVFRGDDRGGLDPYFLGVTLDGKLYFHIGNQSGNGAHVVSPSAIPVGQVIHVAGTLDDATGQQRLFINGIEVASQVTTVRPFGTLQSNQTPGIGIGNVQSVLLRESFGGVIDDVRISDRALSPSQFLNAPAVPEPTSLSLVGFSVLSLIAYNWRQRWAKSAG